MGRGKPKDLNTTRDGGDATRRDVHETFASARSSASYLFLFYLTVCNYCVVVVVVVLFDSTLCDVFSFSTRLDVSSSSSFVVVVFVVVVVTENTPYRGVTVRWARPLTASFSFYLYCTRVVNIVVVDTRKTSIPWCDRPFGPSPNGGFPRLASLPCRTLRLGSRLKTCIVDVQRFVLSSYLVCFIFVVVVVVVVLFDSTPFRRLFFS